MRFKVGTATQGIPRRSCIWGLSLVLLSPALRTAPLRAVDLLVGDSLFAVVELESGSRLLTARRAVSVATGNVVGDGAAEWLAALSDGGILVTHSRGVEEILPTPQVAALTCLRARDRERSELVVAYEKGGVAKLDLEEGQWRVLSSERARALASGDLDGDGDEEIVALLSSDHDEGIAVCLETEVPRALAGGISASAVAVGSFLGTGRDQAALVTAGGDLMLLDGERIVRGGLATTRTPRGLAAGDVDGDGRDELLLLDARGQLIVVEKFSSSGYGIRWLLGLAAGSFRSLAVESARPPRFRRGDANNSSDVDLSDAVFVLGCLFLGRPCPECPDAADTNDDGQLDISDAGFLLGWLFLGRLSPPAPGPEGCGPDPTFDLLPACASEGC